MCVCRDVILWIIHVQIGNSVYLLNIINSKFESQTNPIMCESKRQIRAIALNFKCTIQERSSNLTIQERTKWRWKYEIWLYIALMIPMILLSNGLNDNKCKCCPSRPWLMAHELATRARYEYYIDVPNKCVCTTLKLHCPFYTYIECTTITK